MSMSVFHFSVSCLTRSLVVKSFSSYQQTGFNPSMQPGGNRLPPPKNSELPPEFCPESFWNMIVFFIYIALSVSFEGYSANCALIYTIQLFKCSVIVTKMCIFNGIFPKKTSASDPHRGSHRIPLGTTSPRPLHCASPSKLWDLKHFPHTHSRNRGPTTKGGEGREATVAKNLALNKRMRDPDLP